ncbi:MAG: ATP-binding cassette domain-containing protein, partial [Pseudomonadota bacterium]
MSPHLTTTARSPVGILSEVTSVRHCRNSDHGTYDRYSDHAAGEKMRSQDLRAFFGKTQALKGITMSVVERAVTAIIGPSGCGKSTFVRCLNRMHEVVPGAR